MNTTRDFTEEEYEALIIFLKKKFTFVSYNQEIINDSIVWRHDVDFSVHRALSLAKIEHKHGISATYFLQPSSIYYSLFDEEIKKIIKQIISLGHYIGLHFYSQSYNISSTEDLEKYLTFEAQIIENLFQSKVKVFSFHNPSKEDLEKWTEFKYANMINSYSTKIKSEMTYCSDSNGYWRHKNIRETVKNAKNSKFQILTHPVWWTKRTMKPRKKIVLALVGRKEAQLQDYDNLLSTNSRKNIQ